MYFKELKLRADLPEQISTEIMYEIAGARADRIELLRINILNEEANNVSVNKRLSSIIRLLKAMKQDGRIQFFATKDSFESPRTEAVFLQNKYPNLFEKAPSTDGEAEFIFIKL